MKKPQDLKATMQAITGGASPAIAKIVVEAMKLAESARGAAQGLCQIAYSVQPGKRHGSGIISGRYVVPVVVRLCMQLWATGHMQPFQSGTYICNLLSCVLLAVCCREAPK
eukprot:GHUV01023188.1.p1 GENE.GHUV01023188.1~~GHUV01023188.1.p1  ORF type:complete len:111 (+),score=26.14 GHUV01023188.1:236-568(+)